MFDTLEYVTMLNGDIIRGTNMHTEIVDGVLHFLVNYNLFLIKEPTEVDTMESLESTVDIK